MWHIAETRRLIEQRFGFAQLSMARPALKSAFDRQEHVRYHYHELVDLIDEFQQKYLENAVSILLITTEEDSWNAYNEFLLKASAHAIAMVQALHSVADLFAHALYFALDMNHTDPLLPEKVSTGEVAKLLRKDRDTTHLGDMLLELQSTGTAKHVAGLANSAKHRSIVEATVSEDLTGTRTNRHELQFARFDYKNKRYPAVAVTTLLESEYERVNRLSVGMGKALHELLEKGAT